MKEREKERFRREAIRVSTDADYNLFQRLVAEAKLEGLVDIIYVNIAGIESFKSSSYLEVARTCVRFMALQKEGCLPRPLRQLGNRSFSRDKIITCRDVKDQIIYDGDIADCPLPARDLLLHAGMDDDWQEVYFWNLGSAKDLKSHQTSAGCLLLKKPRVFLFTDELINLATGEFVTVQKHQPLAGFISQTFEVYQIINGEIIRIWADYTD